MLTRKRMLRLAAKHGPFVRFFPEGSEGNDPDPNSEPVDPNAEPNEPTEPEPNIEETPQFKGLLRDKQAAEAGKSHFAAESAAFKQRAEAAERALAESKKPRDDIPQLTEDEAAEGVTRGEFANTLHRTLAAHGKELVTEVTKLLDSRETTTKQVNLKKNQRADAQALIRTHTAKIKGTTLDAKTVVDETAAFLGTNNPELLEFLTKQPDYATLLYKIGTGEALVPSVGQRVKLRRNTLLANELDQGGDTPPGGGGPTGDDLSVFEAIMSSGVEMTDEALGKMYET